MALRKVLSLQMAKISLNSNAPENEDVHFSFTAGDFDLASGATYETDDEGLAAAAAEHPWLAVEAAAVEPAAVEPAASVHTIHSAAEVGA